jgi:hypothetical protein
MEQITNEELNYVIEALLFSLCLEITDNWTLDDRNTMLNIAKKLKPNNLNLKNLDLHYFNDNLTPLAKDMISSFPELNLIKIENNPFTE